MSIKRIVTTSDDDDVMFKRKSHSVIRIKFSVKMIKSQNKTAWYVLSNKCASFNFCEEQHLLTIGRGAYSSTCWRNKLEQTCKICGIHHSFPKLLAPKIRSNLNSNMNFENFLIFCKIIVKIFTKSFGSKMVTCPKHFNTLLEVRPCFQMTNASKYLMSAAQWLPKTFFEQYKQPWLW